MKLYGLIGHPLAHSFSQKYFTEKFQKEGINDCTYKLFPLDKISKLPALIAKYPEFEGLNVTIPHKINVIPYLDELDTIAQIIGSVNTIKIIKNNPIGYQSKLRNDNLKLVGYNTDAYGFERAIAPYLKPHHKSALIIGTGGSAKAIGYVLKMFNIDRTFISRNPKNDYFFNFKDFNDDSYRDAGIIINATPLGMYPKVKTFPPIAYNVLTPKHLIFDLVYNPSETLFMQKAKEKGALAVNGLKMLYYQAEKSWEIWNNRDGIKFSDDGKKFSDDEI